MTDVLEGFRSVPTTWPEVKERLTHDGEIYPHLEHVATDAEQWLAVYRSKSESSDLWAAEYPYSEAHGGGPRCFYSVEGDDAEAWLAEA